MILVFAGAGASYAINSDKYPTTVEFFSRLDESINEKIQKLLSPKFKFIINKERKGLIEESQLHEKIDIEDILWLISKVKEDYRNIFSNEIFKEIVETINRESISFMEEQHKELSSLEEKIYENVFRFYTSIPSEDELDPWTFLFFALSGYEKPIELFTTNYDIVLDGMSKYVSVGFENGLEPNNHINNFILNKSYLSKENKNGIRLIKLHGSAKWIRQGEEIINDTGNVKNGVVLYPGFKGFLEESPFKEFYQHLSDMCKKAEYAIFIGFSFRDPEINNILKKDIDENCRIAIINKGSNQYDIFEEDEFPFNMDNCNFILEGFTIKLVDEISNLFID